MATTTFSKPVDEEIKSLNAKITTVDTYTGTDGLVIHRIGRFAQLAALPTVSTTASDAVVSTITNAKFIPSSRVWMATKVYNGSSYVDCYIELATNGKISIKSTTGSIVAGYQANYTQCLGLQYICTGG